MSHKCIPLLKGRLPIYPTLFGHFLCVRNTCLCGYIICWIQDISLQQIICVYLRDVLIQTHAHFKMWRQENWKSSHCAKIKRQGYIFCDIYTVEFSAATSSLSISVTAQKAFSVFPHSFRVVKSCLGSLCWSQSQEAIFPEKAKSFAHLSLNMSQLDGPVWASAGFLSLCTPPFGHPQALHFFPLPSSEIVFLTSVGPSLSQL